MEVLLALIIIISIILVVVVLMISLMAFISGQVDGEDNYYRSKYDNNYWGPPAYAYELGFMFGSRPRKDHAAKNKIRFNR